MKAARFGLAAVLALGALLACATPATAQDAKENQGKKRRALVEQQLERMDQDLKLTAEQKTKVKAALEESNKKRQELMRDTSVPREQRREKMQALMKEQNDKLKAILTTEQFEKWEKARQEMRKNRPEGGKRREKSA